MRKFNSNLLITKVSELIFIAIVCYTSLSLLELLVLYDL